MAPDATVTVDGADTLAAVDVTPIDTVDPPDGAAADSVTVHCDDPGAVRDVGLHDKRLTEGEACALPIVTVAPVPLEETKPPDPEVALVLITWIALDVDDVVLERVKLAVAIVPSAIVFAFNPLMRQTYRPELVELHVTVLPAPVADGPAATETFVKSPAV